MLTKEYEIAKNDVELLSALATATPFKTAMSTSWGGSSALAKVPTSLPTYKDEKVGVAGAAVAVDAVCA